jgi:hypothetical protein
MHRARGANERALLTTLHGRGVKLTSPGQHAAVVQLAMTLARQLDDSDEPNASLASTYLSTLRQLLTATEVKEVEDDGPADTLRRLRSV